MFKFICNWDINHRMLVKSFFWCKSIHRNNPDDWNPTEKIPWTSKNYTSKERLNSPKTSTSSVGGLTSVRVWWSHRPIQACSPSRTTWEITLLLAYVQLLEILCGIWTIIDIHTSCIEGFTLAHFPWLIGVLDVTIYPSAHRQTHVFPFPWAREIGNPDPSH
jgi:hypothetical protein